MKLLIDANLSPRLVERLADLFPGSSHVQSVGLDQSLDAQIWEHALSTGAVIVTKDDDFNHLSVMRGSPPKVILLTLGNCTTTQIEAAIRGHHVEIVDFESDPSTGTLVIG